MNQTFALRCLDEARVVLLDVDGTLIDSNDAHAKAWVQSLAEEGIRVPYEEVRRRIGMGGDHLLPDLVAIEKESERGRRLSQRRGEIFKAIYLRKLGAFPQAHQFLSLLRQRGKKLVVATSGSATDLRGLLRQGGLEELIDEAATASDVKRSKPSPDILEAALEKINARPEEAVMFGDTPYDVAASRRAGVKIIAFECGGWSKPQLAGAIGVFRDPADLLRAMR